MNIHAEIDKYFQMTNAERSTVAAAFKAQDRLHAIIEAYEKCGGEDLTLPTPLLCAIIAARQEV